MIFTANFDGLCEQLRAVKFKQDLFRDFLMFDREILEILRSEERTTWRNLEPFELWC